MKYAQNVIFNQPSIKQIKNVHFVKEFIGLNQWIVKHIYYIHLKMIKKYRNM